MTIGSVDWGFGGYMKKAAFYTLGCKVNQYETEAMKQIFQKEDYEIVDFEEIADIYVINTCTVTSLSDRKSRQMIRKAKKTNDDAIIAVTGCYAQTSAEEIASIPGVNLLIGTKDRNRIIDMVKNFEINKQQLNAVGDIMHTREFETLGLDTYKERTRAIIKIQEGCSQFCSYCIIPYARGPIRSRQPEDVIEEVKSLTLSGFKEIVLTGIHVASYGKDIKNTSLIDIIKKVHEIEGVERIRLGSIEPTTITDKFIEMAVSCEKLCPHYHISLQSGCDETLKRMNRKYDTEKFREVVARLRNNIKDVALTTDIMVGFPGETEIEFNQTLEFLKEISFAKLHVFKYSSRKGTPAATFENQIPPEIKEHRSAMLIELSKTCTSAFNCSFIGKIMPVLYEQEVREKPGYIEGITTNYIRVISRDTCQGISKIIDTKVNEAVEDYVIGEIPCRF